MEHVGIGLGQIHRPHNWEFADAASRTAAVITSGTLIGLVALQLDDGSYWRLSGVAPVAWQAMRGAPLAHGHEIADVNGLQGALDGKDAAGAAAAAVAAHEGAADPHPEYLLPAELKTINGQSLVGPGNIVIAAPDGGSAGDVVGPAGAVDLHVAVFDGVSGKVIKDSGLTLAGTNTGDETAASIKAKLGIATLSGANTGDQDLSGLVPKTTTVNGKPLSANVALVAADVGAPAGSGSSTGTNTGDQDLSGLVPKTTTVNGKPLSANVTLAKADIGLTNVEDKSSATIRGEITSGNVTAALGFTPVSATTVGAANGVASLDAGGKVPAAQLPSFVDDVIEGANLAALPATGSAGLIYVTLDTNKTYRWSGSAYVEISASPGSTDAVTEGATNLYFTAARVRAVVLTGIDLATSAVISAADTVLGALGKLQAQISANVTAIGTKLSKAGDAMTGALDMGNNALNGIKTAVFSGQGNIATTTGAIAVDWSAAQNYKQAEPTGSITYTFTAPPGPCHLQLLIDSDGTSTAQTITLPAAVIQYGQAFAMTANKRSILNFWFDGTNYHMTSLAQV